MIIVNGAFLCRNLTGIERFAFEICKNLDNIIPKDKIGIFIPANTKIKPKYKNIKCLYSKKECKRFPYWDHIIFRNFVKKNHFIPLSFSNVAPLFCPGIVFIHDIYAKLYPKDFSSFKDKLIKIYMCMMYFYAVRSAKLLLTVSEFSKKQIAKTYKIPEEKIFVIPNGWDHFLAIEDDFSIFEKFPLLKARDFYFTLGSLSKRKNLKWIADYAEKNPKELFAISGKAISGLVPDELKKLQTLKNVMLLGYVSDGNVKALMKKCKAFIFPSYYEGFGIPPLEALSVGAKVVVSNAASLPEIYHDCAYYISPDNTDVNLEELISKNVENPSKILEKYTYKNAAHRLYQLLEFE